MKLNKLNKEEQAVIVHKGTEYPFSGEFVDHKEPGTYICRQCDAPLYRSKDKFNSGCGWPSFDDEIEGAILRVPDADGRRTEIVCKRCGGHLGHLFEGEGFTPKNMRHCVNSISMRFIHEHEPHIGTAYFASGCFWGTEYFFMKAPGVVSTLVGFMGGHTTEPSYNEVCQGGTGHIETVQVRYDMRMVSYEQLVQLFFETHDFTQTNGQGPDIGEQYLSCIFYLEQHQYEVARHYIDILEEKGYKVATMLRPAGNFWKAEGYHQQYYERRQSKPYCHVYRKIF